MREQLQVAGLEHELVDVVASPGGQGGGLVDVVRSVEQTLREIASDEGRRCHTGHTSRAKRRYPEWDLPARGVAVRSPEGGTSLTMDALWRRIGEWDLAHDRAAAGGGAGGWDVAHDGEHGARVARCVASGPGTGAGEGGTSLTTD